MEDEDQLIEVSVALPSGELRLLQSRDAVELPDDGGVEWAPLVPYASVLWRSGVALARSLEGRRLNGLRVVELGCGLGLPSLAAARAGTSTLATDQDSEALELLAANAARNGLAIETARVDWTTPDELVARGPFDLVLAADVLYEDAAVEPLLALLPRLGANVELADPGRAPADAFLAAARRHWSITSRTDGVVRIHSLLDKARGQPPAPE